eukprot:scaffold32705_cov76-Cyclotella_meneghiniana.AAC.2
MNGYATTTSIISRSNKPKQSYSTSLIPLSLALVMSMFVINLYFIWRATEINLHHRSSPSNNGRLPIVQTHHAAIRKRKKKHIGSDDNYIRDLLDEANLTLPTEEEEETITNANIPSRSDVTSQYGPHPILHNLESCPVFRSTIPIQHRMMGVAGLFNTGTNYLASLLEHNCHLPNRNSHARLYPFREQVPWGKHNTPNAHRGHHVARGNGGPSWTLNVTWVLPVVIIKDPFHWMVSNCRHEYFLWEHDDMHCPNVTTTTLDSNTENNNIVVPNSFTVPFPKETRQFKSLVHFWNEWYGEYDAQSELYPLVYIRFEDIVFHTEYVIRSLCDCIGGEASEDNGGDFVYLEESAKDYAKVHAGASGFVDAMLRYGNPEYRLEGWTNLDYEYAMDELDGELMTKFGYKYPDWE